MCRLASMARIASTGVLVAWLLGASGPVRAESAPNSGATIMRLQTALQQAALERERVEDARAQAAARADTAEARVAELEKVLASAQRAASGQAAVVERLEQNNATLREAVDTARARIEEIVERFRETAKNLAEVEQERARMEVIASGHEQRIVDCERMNSELVVIAHDAFRAYEKKGVWASIVQREPVTQLGRAQLENQVDAYHVRIDALYRDAGGDPLAALGDEPAANEPVQ